jgi:hypothetical protein
MIPDKEFDLVYGKESSGSLGYYGIKISVCAFRPLTDAEKAEQKKDHGFLKLEVKKLEHVSDSTYKALQLVEDEVMAALAASNPDEMHSAAQDKANLFALFPGLIFGQDIPNGYCSQGCCRHKPWFRITTAIGTFKIGWRKRVINLDWSETVCTKSGEELFPNEDVTKSGCGEHYIHAYGYDKAREYIKAIFASVVVAPSLPEQPPTKKLE